MIAELIEQLAEAALIEALCVPRMLLRDDGLYWRAAQGRMVKLTAGGTHIACEWSAA